MSGRSPTGHSTLGRNKVSGLSRTPAPAASATPATLSAMETRRWLNPTQPQTLQIAVMLLYIQAVLTLIFGGVDLVLFTATIVGGIAAGYGIANEQKWGYGVGVLVAVMPFIDRIVVDGLNHVFSTNIVTLMFEVALVLLLLHPQSRE